MFNFELIMKKVKSPIYNIDFTVYMYRLSRNSINGNFFDLILLCHTSLIMEFNKLPNVLIE